MSRKPSFANLRGASAAAAPELKTAITGPTGAGEADKTPPSRQGRKQIAGFFSPDMSFAMHMLARRQGRSYRR